MKPTRLHSPGPIAASPGARHGLEYARPFDRHERQAHHAALAGKDGVIARVAVPRLCAPGERALRIIEGNVKQRRNAQDRLAALEGIERHRERANRAADLAALEPTVPPPGILR